MAQFRKDTYQYLNDSKTLFEVVMLADQYGDIIGPANPSGMSVDAFGRARSSNPITLFESFHRFQDNGKFNTANTTGGTFVFNANNAFMENSVSSTTGAEVKRETSRVFAYQPGKSLQILTTFCMNTPKTGLRQRIGYFGDQNGVFLEQDNSTISFVKRSYITGSVVDTKISKENWNIDKLDGFGPSQLTLDLTKAQILFIDIEWLGVGSVRMGFVIDGKLIHCHSFHHANLITGTYMTTACLPIRNEITNTGGMTGTATFREICSTVISEGGFDIRGRSRSFGIPITTPKDLPSAGVFYPLISIRLKDSRSDGIVIPTSAEFFGVSNNTRYRYKVVVGPTLTGASWQSYSADSSVEYDISATAMSGGIDATMGYLNISAGAGGNTTELKSSDIFKFQLERNNFLGSNKGFVFTLAAAGAAAGDDAIGALTWEEIT